MAEVPVKHMKAHSPIVLENERSEGLEKVKNDTGAWGFFKYLYGRSALKFLALNLLMLLFAAAIYVVLLIFSNKLASALAALPYSNSFGLGAAPWGGMDAYIASVTSAFTTERALWLSLAVPFVALSLSGGFAALRNAYWTGKLKVIKPFFRGIKQTFLQIFPFTVLISGGLLGVHYVTLATSGWAAIVLQIVLYLILALLAIWTLVFAGVVTLYKQSFLQSVKSASALFVRYAVSNIFSFVLACAMFALLAINFWIVSALALALVVMFGMVFAGLVWMIHMINICGQTQAENQ